MKLVIIAVAFTHSNAFANIIDSDQNGDCHYTISKNAKGNIEIEYSVLSKPSVIGRSFGYEAEVENYIVEIPADLLPLETGREKEISQGYNRLVKYKFNGSKLTWREFATSGASELFSSKFVLKTDEDISFIDEFESSSHASVGTYVTNFANRITHGECRF